MTLFFTSVLSFSVLPSHVPSLTYDVICCYVVASFRNKIEMISPSASIKLTLSVVGVSLTFYTIVDFMVFLSYPERRIKSEHERRWTWKLFVDVALLSVFVLPHSFLALPQVKQIFTRFKLDDLQRTFYVIATCLCLQLLLKNWQPVNEMVIWKFTLESRWGWWSYYLLHTISWLVIYIGNICMDINELLGFKQVYYSVNNLPTPDLCKSPQLRKLYQHMRHPSFIGFLIIFWTSPIMSLDRLLLAFILSSYMFLAWRTDESDYGYQKMQYEKKFNCVRMKQF